MSSQVSSRKSSRLRSPSLIVVTLVLAAGSALPAVAGTAAPTVDVEPVVSADLPRPPTVAPRAASKAAGPTAAQVGDIDSFGRSLRWLGVTGMTVELSDCTSPLVDGYGCQPLAPAPAVTPFSFEGLARIELPARATQSLLCYWFSPVLNVTYTNPGAAPVVARLNYSPTLTVENPGLSTPGLVDPDTGLPFGGRLTTSMTASERFQVPLPAGLSISERTRDSAVCIAGFLNRKTLTEYYGLTDAQATEFFRQPTTVRMNVSGNAQYVSFASLYFGLRIIGD